MKYLIFVVIVFITGCATAERSERKAAEKTRIESATSTSMVVCGHDKYGNLHTLTLSAKYNGCTNPHISSGSTLREGTHASGLGYISKDQAVVVGGATISSNKETCAEFICQGISQEEDEN